MRFFHGTTRKTHRFTQVGTGTRLPAKREREVFFFTVQSFAELPPCAIVCACQHALPLVCSNVGPTPAPIAFEHMYTPELGGALPAPIPLYAPNTR